MSVFAPTFVLPGVAGGRLTTESGVPVSTSDRSSQSTIYYTPSTSSYGAVIALYNGASWYYLPWTSDPSITFTGPTAITSGTLYDVFAYNNSGTLAIEILAWSSTTARATSITNTNGVWLKSTDTTRRLVGTIEASGTNTVEDSTSKRYVSNIDNLADRKLFSVNNNSSWTYNAASYRESNNGSGQTRAQWVQPLTGPTYLVEGSQNITSNTNGARWGIGFGVTNAASGKSAFWNDAAATINVTSQAFIVPTLGHNFVTMVEYVDGGTATYFGNEAGGACYVHIRN